MNCPVCQIETAPVKIGGQTYCSVCGTPAATNAAPKRLSLDLSPRARTRPSEAIVAPHTPPHAAPTDARALHGRVKPGRVLDLRNAPAPAPKPTVPVVHAQHHEPAAPPKSTAHERHAAHAADRLEKAKQIGKSPLIDKFGGQRLPRRAEETPIHAADHHDTTHHETPHHHAPQAPAHHEPTRSEPARVIASISPVETPPAHELPPHVAAHHAAMAALPKHPDSSVAWRPHLDLSPNRSRVAATVVAIAIMGGYIWLQNYPKLALQNASSKAGVAASLPGYLPSSYSLARTDTSPGLITLNFTSPSISESLKIAQARTTWDSTSLLDNFVAKNADDYSTVQGQGLTIYLFGQNQATWVNKGIWFSIEGTGRLSREQILKMAYSL